MGSLRFSASMLGWKLSMLEGTSSSEISTLLGLNNLNQSDTEAPDFLCLLTPSELVTPFQWHFPKEATLLLEKEYSFQ